MTATTKDLVEALTKTLKNINQSPTIPLPVFKGKKGEDRGDHILKVEDYLGPFAKISIGNTPFKSYQITHEFQKHRCKQEKDQI